MAVKKKFGVEGLKELEKALHDFDADITKTAMRVAARDAMKPVAERAKDLAPEDKGHLKESVKVTSGTSRGRYNDRVAWAAVKAGGRGKKDADGREPGEYVLSMHYGNFKDEDVPFLLDAFEPHSQTILADYKKELTIQVEKAATKQARRNKKR